MTKSTLSRRFRGLGAVVALTLVAILAATGCVASTDAAGDGTESSTAGDAVPGINTTHTGQGTFYASSDDGGHCSFGKGSSVYFGAMNHTEYAGSATCGMCAQITGPSGSVKVQITNECPECKPGDIDLSEQAFQKLAPLSRGRIPIRWKYAPCDVEGPIVYHFKEGTNPYWNAVQVRNAKTGIAKLEAQKDGKFITLRRETYNYFIADAGLGAGPYTLRVTDVNGKVITDTGVAFAPGGDVPSPSKRQFP
jgi:expansin